MSIEKRFNLAGRTALITGGGRGIGRSISQVLAEAGASLMIISRDQATLDRAASDLCGLGRVETCSADLGKRDEVSRVAETALSSFGHIDILVHCAALPGGGEAVVDISDDAWDAMHELNLFSAMALTRAFAPGMIGRGWGRIIYISSVASQRGYQAGRHAAYSASKAALHGLMRATAAELGASGVTANCIMAGTFATDMSKGVINDPKLFAALSQQSAVQRIAEPADMEGPILLLASDAGRYVSGSLLYVDGGYAVLK